MYTQAVSHVLHHARGNALARGSWLAADNWATGEYDPEAQGEQQDRVTGERRDLPPFGESSGQRGGGADDRGRFGAVQEG